MARAVRDERQLRRLQPFAVAVLRLEPEPTCGDDMEPDVAGHRRERQPPRRGEFRVAVEGPVHAQEVERFAKRVGGRPRIDRHPRSMRCRSADRPGRRTIGHESAIPSHRQSRPESPQWTKTDNHLGDDETMHTQTQRSSSAARARRGRRVVERLRARGLPVRVGSRSGEPPFDWEDRSTWAPALDGVASAYVSYYPDIATPGA